MGNKSGTELSINHYKIMALCVCYIQWNLIDTISWVPENKAYHLKIVSNVLSNQFFFIYLFSILPLSVESIAGGHYKEIIMLKKKSTFCKHALLYRAFKAKITHKFKLTFQKHACCAHEMKYNHEEGLQPVCQAKRINALSIMRNVQT